MSDDAKEIFSKISPDERLRLFKDLATIRGEIACKGDGVDSYRLVVERAIGKKELQCSVPFGLVLPKKEIDVLGNFFIGGERYFFKTPVRVEKTIVILSMETDLFHLQRRQNYRIRIPESYQATLLITTYNKTPVKLSGKVTDLSIGGCRAILIASLPILEKEDRLGGYIEIRKRQPLEIECIIRHHKLEKNVAVTKQIVGVEFNPLTPATEGKLFAITMDLHREFFSRLNTES